MLRSLRPQTHPTRWSFWFGLLFFSLVLGRLRAEDGGGVTPVRTAQQIMESARNSVVVIRQAGRDNAREGLGTGFVIASDGLIATSLHVIGEGRPLTISFADGSSGTVTEIHAWDRKLDLAVVRVAAKDLPALRLGDSDNLQPGASVVAIGNPQGLAHSIVQGVVSALRDFEYGPMIQLAIPIEPGNSGGPLLDMKGRVQGILEMKSAVTDNLGFAIPINALQRLLEHPNPVPMEKWQAIGTLNPSLWRPLMGAQWRQKTGTIRVEGLGGGFGGRSLCLAQKEVPEVPYEIAVTVRLDDEAGAAGLAFGSDGGDRHYGFYPSAGQLRLTRFDGPSVYTWNILRQLDTPHYHPGEWNRLKVRIEAERILCFVNGQLVTTVDESVSRNAGPEGKAGLAKFRNTIAQFKNFQLGRSVDSAVEQNPPPAGGENLRQQWQAALEKKPSIESLPEGLLRDSVAARAQLLALAHDWDEQAGQARKLARELHQKSVERELVALLRATENEIDLFAAAFCVARVEAPELELELYREEINSLVQEIEKRWSDAAEPPGSRAKLDHLRQYLFEESGFHGSRSDYYNRANSFMNRVIEDREGIPITLAILFLELGRKLEIGKLEGMPFPGHFMVRWVEGAGEPAYIDVFDGGKLYQKSELYGLIAGHSEVPLRQEHFKPARKREIVIRMLKNLVGTQETASRVLPYLDLLLAIAPDDAQEHWRRASLRLRSGERKLASDDLRWLLENKPDGFDLEQVEELYRSLK